MKNKEIMMGIVVAMITVILTLLLIETGLHIVDYTYHPLHIELPEEIVGNDWREHHAFNDTDFIYDQRMLWRPNTESAAFNQEGFIGKEVNRSVKHLIFALGDSNTAGPFNANVTWPYFLEKRLKEESKDVQVINGGIWGHSIYQGQFRFEEIAQYNPDIVFLSYGSNDAHPMKKTDEEWAQISIPVNNNIRLKSLYQATKNKMYAISSSTENFTHRVPPEEYKKILKKIIQDAKKQDIKLIVLTRPYREKNDSVKGSPFWWRTYIEEYNQIVLKIAQEEQIFAIDIASYFKGKDELFSDESHFNVEGYKNMSRYIAEKMKEADILGQE